MKLALIGLTAALSLNALGATDWSQLVTEAKNIEVEKVRLDEKGYVELNVAKLTNNKYRFVGFTSLGNQNKMKLTIHSNKNDIEKLCNDYSVFKKSFKAELSFNVTPIANSFDFVLGNGKKVTSEEFDNPVTLLETEAAPVSENDKFPWTINSGDLRKFRDVGVKVGFANLLNAAIKESTDNTASVDLSNYNGIACDLASGFIKPVLTKTAQFEKALPESSYWIGQESFSDLYKAFWADHSKINTEKSVEEIKASELVLIGLNLAEKNAERESVFKGKARIGNLLSALKYKSGALNPVEQWKQTFEYSVPTTTLAKQKMTIQYGDVFTSFEE